MQLGFAFLSVSILGLTFLTKQDENLITFRDFVYDTKGMMPFPFGYCFWSQMRRCILGNLVLPTTLFIFISRIQNKSYTKEFQLDLHLYASLPIMDIFVPVLLSSWDYGVCEVLQWNNFLKKESNLSFVAAKIQQNCSLSGNHNSKVTRHKNIRFIQ